MKPPTPEEVEEYSRTIEYSIDGNAFCDFYEIRGWTIGRHGAAIKSWQACVRTWKRYDKQRSSQNGQPPILE